MPNLEGISQHSQQMVTKLSINVSQQCNFLDAHLLFITSNNYFARCNSQAAVVTDSLVSIYLPTYLSIYLSIRFQGGWQEHFPFTMAHGS